MPDQLSTDDGLAYRKAFIAKWLPEAYQILRVRAVDVPLDERDAKSCPDELYAEAVAANLARAERLAKAVSDDKVRASETLLRKLGRVPTTGDDGEGAPLPESAQEV